MMTMMAADNSQLNNVAYNDTYYMMEDNTSYSENNMTSPVGFYVSASDQRFRNVVNAMEVYWVPIIFVLGMYM